MKNTICEKLMWSAMTPAIFKYIAANCKNTDTFRVKKKSRKNLKICGEDTRHRRFYEKSSANLSFRRNCLDGSL